MIHSPSKYMSLKRLQQIKKDNYIGEGGKEYCGIEVEELIAQKMQSVGMKEAAEAIKLETEMLAAMWTAEAAEIEQKRIELSWTVACENFMSEMKQTILSNGVLV